MSTIAPLNITLKSTGNARKFGIPTGSTHSVSSPPSAAHANGMNALSPTALKDVTSSAVNTSVTIMQDVKSDGLGHSSEDSYTALESDSEMGLTSPPPIPVKKPRDLPASPAKSPEPLNLTANESPKRKASEIRSVPGSPTKSAANLEDQKLKAKMELKAKARQNLLQPLEAFDLDGMTAQYEEAMMTISKEEANLFNEYTALCQDMQAWSRSRLVEENLRVKRRVSVSVNWIRNKEADLETLRQGLVTVMDSVKKALDGMLAMSMNEAGLGGLDSEVRDYY
ncbi:hypothetical protein SAICODRAFT_9433 [Saitoella complicata NRRL Y-17804]|uniref:Uncharacterized protein n=1 Tax=Saitoella complicata (strain BCRC 22490 / CBS 7301 / JCM 7358 / NBRC 10748 / NRRL Y-17804) TaxID=698492 RepID=A0A0E9NNK0_SAICN|nr:uncharacterized protein SAICODRAFT_9433 [Saitoella complicata NRRL Y-17804]ODQ51111.1 hypothetical protein SAICODRAFT_9433 [Saitoella complicata NRRL Y-17804]GAO51281.1 hypothetical protein G7K_5387-t1 [Saitoella complicata NRRL Y-17804]